MLTRENKVVFWVTNIQKNQKKNSDAHIGKATTIGVSPSIEARKKISLSLTGRKQSAETIQKRSISLKGKCLGRKNSEETRKKMSNSHRGKRGEETSHWKGGITPLNVKIRTSIPYIEWRKKVFLRDNFTCKLCARSSVCLNAHHIKPFSKYPDLRFETSNGVTLCRKCHAGIKGKEDKHIELLSKLISNVC